MATLNLEARIVEIAHTTRRYAPEAYWFIFDTLDFVLSRPHRTSSERNISTKDLLDGVRLYALEQYGPLAACVFEDWGVSRTEDFGEIAFQLIRNELLHQGEHDRQEDFANGFDFHEAFEEGYVPTIRHEPVRRHCHFCTCECGH